MHALASRTSAHAHPRVRLRSRATGCKTASRRISSFSRAFPHARCAPAQTEPRETALFLGASVSGATDYNYFRNYMPNQGRYTQADPIGLGGGWNRFGYVGGNPLTSFDPDGLNARQMAMFCAKDPKACANAATAAVGAGIAAATGAVSSAVDAVKEFCKTDDEDTCDIILDKSQLKRAGIKGIEHDVKEDALGTNKGLSKFDICGCKDGRVVVKKHGCKGPIVAETDYRWK